VFSLSEGSLKSFQAALNLCYRHSRAGGNLGGSDAVVRFKGMAEYPDKIPACAGMTALVIFRLP